MAAIVYKGTRLTIKILVLLLNILLCSTTIINEICELKCICTEFAVNCSSSGLAGDLTGLSTSTQILDLSGVEYNGINKTIIPSLTHLTDLRLGNASLLQFPALGTLPNLSTLILYKNSISDLRSTYLGLLGGLRSLDLSHNKIGDLGPGIFRSNSALEHLNLSNNRLTTLDVSWMNDLVHLDTFKANKNRISRIGKDVFRKMDKLKHLELNRNRLNEIEGLNFQGLESVLSLRLQANGITNLQDGAFWGMSKINILKLDNNNITTVSKGWLYGLSSLQHLSLRYNMISVILNGGWEFCENLMNLDMAYNRMHLISKETFKRLPRLVELNLAHNSISFIEDSSFSDLPTLEILDLSSNEISWTIEDMHGAFSGLKNLAKLNLASNQIRSIGSNAFVGLDRLQELDVSSNYIATIENNAFQSLMNLRRVDMNTNSLLCDCHLAWLPEWLLKTDFEERVVAVCAHPLWHKTKSVTSLSADDYKCDDFPKPYIIEQPQSSIALKGDNMTLSCSAASSANTPVTFLWKKDNQLVKSGVSSTENFARTEANTEITKYMTTLHFANITDQDEGKYQCIISNQYGSSYSDKAMITVHMYPQFTKTPADVTVKAGNTARLECAAKGQPPPEIAWQKDGGDDFPAARERRMHVMFTDDVFFIVGVKSSDSGVYSCTAKNAAAMIMANTTLTVLETPHFINRMEKKEVRAGETAVMECNGGGYPKPKLTWYRDGKELPTSERHFFTTENQLFVIRNADQSDAGEYSCEITNTLGTERGSARLTVISNDLSVSDIWDFEQKTVGIIIIVVVFCVVLTSFIWLLIIYKTRQSAVRKMQQQQKYTIANRKGDENNFNVAADLIAYQTTTNSTDLDFSISAPHLFTDNNSLHSSKDSGTGDSARRSNDDLILQPIIDDCEHPTAVVLLDAKGRHHIFTTASEMVSLAPSSRLLRRSKSSHESINAPGYEFEKGVPSQVYDRVSVYYRPDSPLVTFHPRPTNHERSQSLCEDDTTVHCACSESNDPQMASVRSQLECGSSDSPRFIGQKSMSVDSLGGERAPANVSGNAVSDFSRDWRTAAPTVLSQNICVPNENEDSGRFCVTSVKNNCALVTNRKDGRFDLDSCDDVLDKSDLPLLHRSTT